MKQAGDVLKTIFEGLGINDEKNYAGFFHEWRRIVGETLFAHCRAADIRDHILVLAVDHPGWMSRIKFNEREILRSIKAKYPQLGLRSIAYTLVNDLSPVVSDHNNARETGLASDQNDIFVEEAVDKLTKPVEKNSPGAPVGAPDLKAALASLKRSIELKQRDQKNNK